MARTRRTKNQLRLDRMQRDEEATTEAHEQHDRDLREAREFDARYRASLGHRYVANVQMNATWKKVFRQT